jgi:DNA processing protein
VPTPHRPDAPARIDARALRGADPGYPDGLRDLPDPPAVVFIAGGDLPEVRGAVAMVGSRAASAYGLEQARRLAGDLARCGLVVVSGLARGIDAAAHRGALAAGGRTVAVIPSGLDAITPRHHRDLAATIAGRGALVSEWASGDPRGPGVFVQRNRLIAALAGATVVVEAAVGSGALTTARFAKRLGRPVLSVPGDIDRETARGCHALLRSGALLCERAADVLAVLGAAPAPTGAKRPRAQPPPTPTRVDVPPEARLLAVLGREPATVEDLVMGSGLTVGETLAALLALQWAGAATPVPGQRWTRSGI